MKKGYIILIVIIIVAFFVVRYYNKQQKLKQAAANLNSGIVVKDSGNIVSNFIESVIPTKPPSTTPIVVKPPASYALGDKIYAKANINGYDTSNVQTSGVKDVFIKDELIGTFVAYDNSNPLKMIKVYGEEWYAISRVFYVRADEVYSK